jgi:hypothetical protein
MNARPSAATAPPSSQRPRRWTLVLLAGLVIAVTAGVALFRVGLLGLPAAPAGVTAESAGLADLPAMRELHERLLSEAEPVVALPPGATLVRRGLSRCRTGDTAAGLAQMREGLQLEPNSMVLANAYRMAVFGLRRDALAAARKQGIAAPQFPPELERQPIAFFEALHRQHATRETSLHLALAWVDEMLLFPALEIKAPASVQAVDLLTKTIEDGHVGYVPALFARGLNHLHRPARLVWPESERTARDAAAQDIGRCVAIGRRLGLGTPRLQATLALSLGDAYVKAGRPGVARSWWQLAQNLNRDTEMQEAVRRRYAWQNEELLDRLEEELDRSREALDRPMTDLSFMWN